MFGEYDIPVNIMQENLSISIQKEDGCLIYKRIWLEEEIEKSLLINKGKIIINPVEPLNKPKTLTPYLLINLEKALILEPKSTNKVFIKFPIEIGVYLSDSRDLQILDVFTLVKQKFTLYGDPRNGVLCKHWNSDVYLTVPSVDPLYEGVLEMRIENTNPDWVEINHVVFNAYGMKIFYNDRIVAMKGMMKIRSGSVAETDFVDVPMEQGMTNAIEVYTARKLSITSKEFVMEFGL